MAKKKEQTAKSRSNNKPTKRLRQVGIKVSDVRGPKITKKYK